MPNQCWTCCLVGGLLWVSGCQHGPTYDANIISVRLSQRLELPTETATTQRDQLTLKHGFTEDEAVLLALSNNAAFQTLLADLGIAQSDLIQAGLLPNPEFVYYLGSADKPFKYLLELPIEALWLRPIRLAIATHDANRTIERLTQAGLDLIRDTRQAYTDVLLAQDRLRVAQEAVKLRQQIADLAEKRFQAGDISSQEVTTAQIDARLAKQEATRLSYDVPLAEERLRLLLALGTDRTPLHLKANPLPVGTGLDVDTLILEATANRPDIVAAKEATKAAEERQRLARLGWVRLMGLADATSGRNGHEFGPAARVTVPLFNQNQGGIARADAEYQQTLRNQQTLANQIILDVRRAFLQHQQANAELLMLRRQVRPEMETAIQRTQAAYREGNVTIFLVLETTRQLLDSYAREAQLHADVRRAWVELERSVGRKIHVPPSRVDTDEPSPARSSPRFAEDRGNP